MKSYKYLYEKTFEGKVGYLHFAAHSHHPWPDCTLDAQIQYWRDSTQLLDQKWSYIFEHVLPQAQRNIANVLNLSKPEMIAFAPNTHEFVVRLLSCFENKAKPLKVLTTDSEFHSFQRQILSSKLAGKVELTVVPVEPNSDYEKRWIKESSSGMYDLIFTSHIFYNSGLACPNFDSWIPTVPENTSIVIDAYHSFYAIPTDLSAFEGRIFYLAGGYKYAQAGEGACFLVVPKDSSLRPVNTGWFASFESLSNKSSDVIHYSENGQRFAGSTFDSSGLYRLNAVIDMYREEDLSVEIVNKRVEELKSYFAEKSQSLRKLGKLVLNNGNLPRSHFLTFVCENAGEIELLLRQNNIIVDSRGDRLRFGFGLYHNKSDIDFVVSKLETIL